jgi:hypothetical protein
MDTFTQASIYGTTPLEDKAEQFAMLLRAGLEDEFAKQFKCSTAGMDECQADALVALVNMRLSNGIRRRDLKVVIARKADSPNTITVLDRSRFFGSGWSIARQTFAI